VRLFFGLRSQALWRTGIAAFVLLALLFSETALANPRSVELRRQGFVYAYNLDREEAVAAFREAIKADPNDPGAYRALAAVAWLNLMYLRGAITADDYLGSMMEPNVKMSAPPAELAAMFHTNMEKALRLAELQLKNRPGDADAHFNVGAAVGQMAAYTATVEGTVLSAVNAARRAFDEQGRVLEIDPSRKDAGLITGSYRYAVANLGVVMRWMAYLVGFGGGRDHAIRLLEECAAYASDAQTEARLALVLIYNREQRYDDASRVLTVLREQYPRNRLLWLETGATDMRGGRFGRALAFLNWGVAMFERDTRPKAFGEAALWYAKRGSALVALGERKRAEADLQLAVAAEGREWVHGRCHLELGKLADLAGDRVAAKAAYRRAAALCSKDRDPVGAEEAERWLGRPYTGTIAGNRRQ
jgi:tetratricopeptide (TPR) repeat protein